MAQALAETRLLWTTSCGDRKLGSFCGYCFPLHLFWMNPTKLKHTILITHTHCHIHTHTHTPNSRIADFIPTEVCWPVGEVKVVTSQLFLQRHTSRILKHTHTHTKPFTCTHIDTCIPYKHTHTHTQLRGCHLVALCVIPSGLL